MLCVALFTGIFATLAVFWWNNNTAAHKAVVVGGSSGRLSSPLLSQDKVIHLLEKKGIYSVSDFKNEMDVAIPYWGAAAATDKQSSKQTTPQWGPCFAPHNRVDWDQAIETSWNATTPQYETKIAAPAPVLSKNSMDGEDLAGFCRPGFIIIGAGKCGTSVREESMVHRQSCSDIFLLLSLTR